MFFTLLFLLVLFPTISLLSFSPTPSSINKTPLLLLFYFFFHFFKKLQNMINFEAFVPLIQALLAISSIFGEICDHFNLIWFKFGAQIFCLLLAISILVILIWKFRFSSKIFFGYFKSLRPFSKRRSTINTVKPLQW